MESPALHCLRYGHMPGNTCQPVSAGTVCISIDGMAAFPGQTGGEPGIGLDHPPATDRKYPGFNRIHRPAMGGEYVTVAEGGEAEHDRGNYSANGGVTMHDPVHGDTGAPIVELSQVMPRLRFIGSSRSAARANPAASRRQESTPKTRRLVGFMALTAFGSLNYWR
jgi:hypothetical protein